MGERQMKTVILRAGDAGRDALPLIQKALDEIGEGGTLCFEKGVYPLSAAVELHGKRNLTVDGDGSVFAPFYDREGEYENSADCFHISDCENLTLKRFTVDACLPANSAGRILRVEGDRVTVRMHARVPFTGRERFIDGMTFTEDGMPLAYWFKNRYDPAIRTVIEGEIACTAPRRLEPEKEYLGEQTFRVYGGMGDLSGVLRPGMRCSVSHTYYGLSAFTFRNCREVLAEDVRIANFGGFGFLILPRCADFTFRRVEIRTADPEHQPYGTTSDGIHMTGLGGRLLMEDCVFERLGDDSFNIHTQVMTVRACGADRVRLAYEKVNGIVSPDWLRTGDELWAYDPVTLEMRGRITAGRVFAQGEFAPAGDASFLRPGDFVTNRAYFPETVICGCVMRHCRGRGCCIQGVESLVMEQCEIGPAKGPAVYLSTAFNEWKEAGPLQNVTIRNNRFRGVPGEDGREMDNPLRGTALLAWLRGKEYAGLACVHRNITVENNLFRDYHRKNGIHIASADGVTVRGNRFENCRFEGEKVHIEHCGHVEVSDV